MNLCNICRNLITPDETRRYCAKGEQVDLLYATCSNFNQLYEEMGYYSTKCIVCSRIFTLKEEFFSPHNIVKEELICDDCKRA